jgi:hypothetical protein
MPQSCQRIGVKRWSHGCGYIRLHHQLEHALFAIKVTSIEDLKHKGFHPIQYCVLLEQKVVLITTSVLGKMLHSLPIANTWDT